MASTSGMIGGETTPRYPLTCTPIGPPRRPSVATLPGAFASHLELPGDEVHWADQVAPAVADLPPLVPVPVDDHALDAEPVHPLLQGDAEVRVVHHQVQ